MKKIVFALVVGAIVALAAEYVFERLTSPQPEGAHVSVEKSISNFHAETQPLSAKESTGAVSLTEDARLIARARFMTQVLMGRNEMAEHDDTDSRGIIINTANDAANSKWHFTPKEIGIPDDLVTKLKIGGEEDTK